MFADVDFSDAGIRWVSSRVFLNPRLGGRQRRRIDRLRQLAGRRAQNRWAALTRCGIIFEEVVRIWLSEYFDVSCNRLLSWKQEEERAALEIDSATYDEGYNPEIFFEVGFSVTGWKAVSRKCRQLRRALFIARERWPHVRGCVILVHAGIQELKPEPALIEGLALDVEAFQREIDTHGFSVLVLELERTWQFAQEVGVPLCPELRTQVQRAAEEWSREYLQ